MGKVIAICISEEKGTQKHSVQEAEFIEDWGIKGDAHAGKWHRQVSLLSFDKIEDFRARGAEVTDGAFGENIVVEGFDFAAMPVGTRFRCNDVILETDRQKMPPWLRDFPGYGRLYYAKRGRIYKSNSRRCDPSGRRISVL